MIRTRRLTPGVASQRAMADIAVALHRSNGLLSIAKMSKLSGVARTEIYKILRRCDGKDDAPSR